jgi:hypothetical protein
MYELTDCFAGVVRRVEFMTPTALPAAGTSPQWGEAGRGSSEAERQVEALFEGLLSEAFA